MASFKKHLVPLHGNQTVGQQMKIDDERTVLCMNIFDRITYGKQFADAIKKKTYKAV